VADLRRIWIGKRQPFMANHLERLVFIDETSVKTNMAKTTGWAPRGQRLEPPRVSERVMISKDDPYGIEEANPEVHGNRPVLTAST